MRLLLICQFSDGFLNILIGYFAAFRIGIFFGYEMEQYGEIQIILFVAEKAKLFNGGNENSYMVGISDIRNKIRIGRNKFTVMDGDGAAFFFPANVTGGKMRTNESTQQGTDGYYKIGI